MKRTRMALCAALSLVLLLAAPLARAAGDGLFVLIDAETERTLSVGIPQEYADVTALCVRVKVQGGDIENPRFIFTGSQAVRQALYDPSTITLTLYLADDEPLSPDGGVLELGYLADGGAYLSARGAQIEAVRTPQPPQEQTVSQPQEPEPPASEADSPASDTQPESAAAPSSAAQSENEAPPQSDDSVAAQLPYDDSGWNEDAAFSGGGRLWGVPWYVWTVVALLAAVLALFVSEVVLRLRDRAHWKKIGVRFLDEEPRPARRHIDRKG